MALSKKEMHWFREVAAASEIIFALSIDMSLDERAKVALDILEGRARRRDLSAAESADLAGLREGGWLSLMAQALEREKQRTEAVRRDLEDIARVKVDPEWIVLAYSTLETAGRRSKQKMMAERATRDENGQTGRRVDLRHDAGAIRRTGRAELSHWRRDAHGWIGCIGDGAPAEPTL